MRGMKSVRNRIECDEIISSCCTHDVACDLEGQLPRLKSRRRALSVCMQLLLYSKTFRLHSSSLGGGGGVTQRTTSKEQYKVVI
jgi:hypothetical protein